MKTKLLLTAGLLISAGMLFSQSLELSHEGEPLEQNSEISAEGPVTNEVVVELDVTNVGSTTIEVLCQRYEQEMVPGSMSALCWGGLCYPPNVSLSAFSTTIEPGETITGDFSGHYYPNGNSGVSTISYTFFDIDNENDSVMVTVLYNGLTVGISENGKLDHVEAYPNPANSFLTVDLNAGDIQEEIIFELVDVNGSVVRKAFSGKDEIRINTSELAEGIYLYRALMNNAVVASDKLIIKH